MNIMYVVPRFPTASETFISEEIIGVRERGHVVNVVALARPSEEEISRLGQRARSLIDDVIYLPRLPINTEIFSAFRKSDVRALHRTLNAGSLGKASSLLRFFRAASIAALAKKKGANLLYAHWPRPTEVAVVASEISRIPLAMSVHAHEVAHDNSHFRVAFERVRFAAFCNQAAMEYLLDKMPPIARSKSHLVYHGVDLQQFQPSEITPLSDTLHLVTAGRLTATKGFDRLIRAVDLARKRAVPLTLTILGDGSQRGDLESLTKELKLESLVRFSGWVPHEQIRELLRAAHLFALLADDTFHDGLPNVVLEALALGRPVVISPLPAAREAVSHEVGGYILREVDALDEFVDCCRNIIANPQKLSDWSSAAAHSVRQKHDRAIQLDILCGLFEQVRAVNTFIPN